MWWGAAGFQTTFQRLSDHPSGRPLGSELAGTPNAELAGTPNAELAGIPSAELAGIAITAAVPSVHPCVRPSVCPSDVTSPDCVALGFVCGELFPRRCY